MLFEAVPVSTAPDPLPDTRLLLAVEELAEDVEDEELELLLELEDEDHDEEDDHEVEEGVHWDDDDDQLVAGGV